MFHFSKVSQAIVGMSVVRDDPWPDEVVWGAKGTSARGNNVQPYARPGFRRALQHHQRLEAPVTLEEIRAAEVKVFEIRRSLEERHGQPLYFPFVPYSGSALRTFQGYMVKMPVDLVRLFGLPEGSVEVRSGALPEASRDEAADRPGSLYRWADEDVAVSSVEPQPVDPALMERALASHRHLQNAVAGFLLEQGLEPLSPGPSDPDWDIAWWQDGTLWVVEVKSTHPGNEERQLRLGLGQLLRYRQRLQADGHSVRSVLLVERAPVDRSWAELCGSVGVTLSWPRQPASAIRLG